MIENNENKQTPDEFFKGLDFFDFLNKGNEISETRKTISSIIENHTKKMIEEVLQFIYKDTYKDVNNDSPERDRPKVIQNAFKVPINLIKEDNGALVYHCVDRPITLDNMRSIVGRNEKDFVVYKTFKINSYRDSSSIVFAKSTQKEFLANIIVDQLIMSYNKDESSITIYCTKDFPNIDYIVNEVLDYSGFNSKFGKSLDEVDKES